MPGYELIGKEERQAIDEIFENGAVFFAHGFHDRRKGIYRVREFEKEFAQHLGVKHAIAVSSGTAALKIALKAAGVKPGDEVITQAFTFIATVEAILDIGAVPVVVNADESLNLSVEELRRRITPKTRAIMPVHMHGAAADMENICKVARERGIPVIEDNCQALGARFNGRLLGTMGDIGAFSFDFGKSLTTGEGGMVVTDDDAFAKFAREYHDHGHENNPKLPRGRDTRTIYGFNYRMTEIQGAIGRVQLRKLEHLVAENKKRYEALEGELKDGFTLRHQFPGSTPLYDTVMFKVENNALQNSIIEYLGKSGFGTKNVPDAVEWHFAGYWEHVFTKAEIESFKPTGELLKKYVSIGINVSRSAEEYAELGRNIRRLAL